MKKLLIILGFTCFTATQAQQLLTIDDAISRALKNNYNILVARNNADIARINNTSGNAGMLPNIAINGSGSYQRNDVTQTSTLAGDTHNSDISARSLGANIELTWKLYDGGRMFVTKNKLTQIEALGEIRFQGQVTQTLFNVIAAYYDVVRQKQQLKAINEAINYNRERVKIAQKAFTSGASDKTGLLLAKIDLNVYTENAINQQAAILATQRTLNVLLGDNREASFEVSDSIPLNYSPDRTELAQKLFTKNPGILDRKKQIDIAKLTLKENNRARLPLLNFRTGYYLSDISNSAGSMLKNRTLGPQVGGTLSVPLYTGGEIRRKINTAKMELHAAEYSLENTKIETNSALQNALTEFDNQKRLVEIEQENNLLTRENLDISLQRLRLGQTTSLEVHQAQESHVQSSTRLTNFKYNLKIAEARLKQLLAEL